MNMIEIFFKFGEYSNYYVDWKMVLFDIYYYMNDIVSVECDFIILYV